MSNFRGMATICQCNGTQRAQGKWRLWHRTPPLAAMPQAAIFGPLFLARAIAAFAFWQSLVAPDFS